MAPSGGTVAVLCCCTRQAWLHDLTRTTRLLLARVVDSDTDGDLAEITSITVTVTDNGRRRSIVQTAPDGLILEQIQPLTLSYELVLPNQAGTITGECAAESVVTRTAVEPVDE